MDKIRRLETLKELIGEDISLIELDNYVQNILYKDDDDKSSIFKGNILTSLMNGSKVYEMWKHSEGYDPVSIKVFLKLIKDDVSEEVYNLFDKYNRYCEREKLYEHISEIISGIRVKVVNVEDVITCKQVLNNLEEMIGSEFDYGEVIERFEDFEEDGEYSVYVGDGHSPDQYDYIAYIDTEDSTQFLFETDCDDVVTDIWTYTRL